MAYQAATIVNVSSIKPDYYPSESSILPYTEGLTGVNLVQNAILSNYLYGSLCVILLVVLAFRIVQVTSAHLRLLSALNSNGDQQQYWTRDDTCFAKIKKHLLVAPLFQKRHNKEFQIPSALGIRICPSRLHTLFLTFYVLSNLLYCCLLDYYNQPHAALLAEARGRTGHLCVINMLPLFLFSARNNPLIPILGISFDTFNLFHRWIGRIVVIQALAHTFLWGANNYVARGIDGLTVHLRGDPFLVTGALATAAMTAILFQSVSFLRRAFYESFLVLHQVLAIAALAATLLHCKINALPQVPLLWAMVALWATERLMRLWRMVYRRGANMTVEALEGGACRVTFDIRGKWARNPGCHIYAYIPSISLWMSHPFSVAWVDNHPDAKPSPPQGPLPWSPALSQAKTLSSTPNSPVNEELGFVLPAKRNKRTQISCVMASRTGMTASLYKRARASPTGIIHLSAFVEGPYGPTSNVRSYGTVLLFAGGVGITHQLSVLHDIVNGFADGTCATRRAVLVWSVRTIEQLEWIRPWVEELRRMPRRGNVLKIQLYVTRTALSEEGAKAAMEKETGFGEQVCFGRMDAKKIVGEEFEQRVGAMSVGVCGPGGLADDVRAASRGCMDRGNVEFWEESFTW